MSFVGSNILAGASGQGGAGYEIERSLRFNSGDSAYLSRTPSAAGNSKTWTLSFWIKRAGFGTANCLFMAYNGSSIAEDNYATIEFSSNDTLRVGYAYASYKQTARVFRDPSAWYHIVIAIDTTNSTAGDRVQIYVNGIKETTFNATHDPDLNQDLAWNKASFLHRLCSEYNQQYSNAYLAEVYFVDGQALAPTDFGEFDDNNFWQPKEYTGAYSSTNTSTSLSQTGWDPSTTNAGNHTLIWDGNTGQKAYGYNGGTIGTVAFSPPLTNVTKVECYTQDYVHYLNGSSISTPETVNGGWHTYYDNSSTPITLASLGNSYTNNTQTVDLAAIRINGSHIINSQTWTPPSGSGIGLQDTGANSFYLKFADNSSNAVLGTDSSGNSNTWTVNNLSVASGNGSYISGSISGAANNGSVSEAFNGSVNRAAQTTGINTASGSLISYTLPSSVSYSSKVEVAAYKNSGGAGYVGLGTSDPTSGGITVPQVSIGADVPWTTVATGSGTLSAIALKNVNERIGFVAVRIDGTTVLTDNSFSFGNDSLVDTPTNYTATPNSGGNYATLNPLHKGSTATLSNGNLDLVNTSWATTVSTIGMSSGKWYAEVTLTGTILYPALGVSALNTAYPTSYFGQTADSYVWFAYSSAGLFTAGAYISQTGDWVTNSSSGDVIGLALDMDNGTLKYYRNGNLLGGGNAFTGITGTQFFATCGYNQPEKWNFGQRPFAYTPPTGYKSLCTTNLPDPTIEDPSTAFDVKTFVSNNGNSKSISLGFSPDMVWTKSRANAYEGQIFDAVRGDDREMSTNATRADRTLAGSLTFDSAGFTMPSANNNANYGVDYASVGWAWDAGTTPSNPVGDVWSGGATKYIGIKFASASGGTVSYGQSSGSTTVEVWTSSDNANWTQQGSTQTLSTGHTLTTSDQYVYIRNSSNATFTNWYAAATNGADGHYSGSTYPSGASWSGPGYTDYDFRDGGGTLIHTGSMNSSAYNQSQTWSNSITATGSSLTNAAGAFNNSVAYSDSAYTTASTGSNDRSVTAAIGITLDNEYVEVYPRETYSGYYVTIDGTAQTTQYVGASNGWKVMGPYTGTLTSVTVTNGTDSSNRAAGIRGIRVAGKELVDSGVTITNNVPSVATIHRVNQSAGFSIVSFENGSGTVTVGHGLNAAPEFIITKSRDSTNNWQIYHAGAGNNKKFYFTTNAEVSSSMWGNTDPTSYVFSLDDGSTDSWIAYCFAPVEGYSSFGKYTGNGSTDGPFVYTGFRPKYLMWKRTDNSENWMVLDSERSTINQMDDFLCPNTNAAEVADAHAYMDFLSNGFKIRTNYGQTNASTTATYVYAAFAEHPFKTARAR